MSDGVPGGSRRPIRVRSDGIPRGTGCEAVRSTPEPNRQRIDGPLIRIRPGPLAGHLRRDAARGGHRQAAPIDLLGGQDGGPVPQHTADEGGGIEGVVGDGVARDQRDDRGDGVVGPRADDDVGSSVGVPPLPVPLPGCMPEIPAEPVMTNDAGMAMPGKALVRT